MRITKEVLRFEAGNSEIEKICRAALCSRSPAALASARGPIGRAEASAKHSPTHAAALDARSRWRFGLVPKSVPISLAAGRARHATTRPLASSRSSHRGVPAQARTRALRVTPCRATAPATRPGGTCGWRAKERGFDPTGRVYHKRLFAVH